MSKMNGTRIEELTDSLNALDVSSDEARMVRELGRLDPTVAEITLRMSERQSTAKIRDDLQLGSDEKVQQLHIQGLRALYTRKTNIVA
jgi:hypothetical protein